MTAARCILTYLVIPIGAPLLSLSNAVTAPLGLMLCAIAAVNGVISLRRFWAADHRARWMYTGFIAVVFLTLIVAVALDIGRLLPR